MPDDSIRGLLQKNEEEEVENEKASSVKGDTVVEEERNPRASVTNGVTEGDDENKGMLTDIFELEEVVAEERESASPKCGNLFPRDEEGKREGGKLYRCEHCPKVYPSQGGLNYHRHIHHSIRYTPPVCDICGKTFRIQKYLESHKYTVHFKQKDHLCDLCGKDFSSKYGLKLHKIWHRGEKNFPCDICGMRFSTVGKVNTHRQVHGGPKNYICEVCSRAFRWKKGLLTHMRTHSGERPYRCEHCDRKFAALWNMQQHLRIHTGERPYKCDICGKAFSLNASMKEHKNRHHKNLSNGVTVKTEEYHVAEVSPENAEDGKGELEDSEEEKEGKSTPKPDLWAPFTVGVKVEREDIDPSRYVIVVENQKKSGGRVEGGMKSKKSIPEAGKKRERRRQGGRKKRGRRSFTCDICREVLDNEEELEGHRKSKHINEKSEFFCDFCLKVFKTKAILKGHRYKHVTDPQFLCVRCGKKYFTISNLNEHSLYCLDEKKFECPVCYKKFNVNKQFKRHLVIHEADRYIKCTVCEQTFSRKDNYRQHFRRHTGEKPYTCDICGKSFRIKATYNYHRRTHRDVRANDADSHKADASEAEFGGLLGRRKEAGDAFFHGVPENSNFGVVRDGTEYAYAREDSATFPEASGEKQSNQEGQQFLDGTASDFPDSFLRKEGYQEQGLPDPYGRLPQTE